MEENKPTKNCTIRDCERLAIARQMCRKHYNRWRKHGNAETVLSHNYPAKDELEALSRVGWTITDSGCWEWNGSSKRGYGQVTINYKNLSVHRVSFKVFKGIDPGEFEVCHSCDNRICLNPEHLFLGTHQENMADGASKNRMPRGDNNKMSKLREDDIVDIRNRMADGESLSSLSRRYGVSRTALRYLRDGKTWKWI